MEIKDSSTMPDECGPVFFSGDTDIFQVPDKCCTAKVGAEPLIPFGQFGSYKGIEGCFALDPFQDGNITAVLVNGCYDDGTQFYGEKCGGSNLLVKVYLKSFLTYIVHTCCFAFYYMPSITCNCPFQLIHRSTLFYVSSHCKDEQFIRLYCNSSCITLSWRTFSGW